MLDSFFRSVTKDSYGPISFLSGHGAIPVVTHKFHDTFSRFQWGKMPDPIQGRGKQNAFLFTRLNHAVQSPEVWASFLRSPDALSFRKAASSIPNGQISADLNDLVERFPARTSFIGVISEERFKQIGMNDVLKPEDLLPLSSVLQSTEPRSLYPVSEFYPEEKIPVGAVMGRAVWDFSVFQKQTAPKMLPIQIHSHFSLTENSLKHLNTESLALPKTASLSSLQAGASWDFPLLELSIPSHPFQKKISFNEALLITGYAPAKLQRLLLQAAWISALARNQLETGSRKELKLNSVSLRFAEAVDGGFVLVDSLELDDLDLEIKGQGLYQATDEYYLKTSWSEAVLRAQKQAQQSGGSEWKRLCVEPAPFLDSRVKSNLEQLHKDIFDVCTDRNRV